MADPWIGHRQFWVLQHMRESRTGAWDKFYGWTYGGPFETAKIMESLRRHGFVKLTGKEHPVLADRAYKITVEGRMYVARNPGGR